MRQGSIENIKGVSITPRPKKTTTRVGNGITDKITETSIEITTDNSVRVERKRSENGGENSGRQRRREVYTMKAERTNLKGQGMGVGRRELIHREGTGRRDQAGDTTRTTITSTRDRSTV
jgi:hypothetical protein